MANEAERSADRSDEVSERDGKNGEDNEVGEDEAVNEGRLPKADEVTAGNLAAGSATDTAVDAASFADNDDADNARASSTGSIMSLLGGTYQ